MITVHVHINGRVQGVGFRPFIYNLALSCGLKGWVSNGSDGVHIEISGIEPEIEGFLSSVKLKPPKYAIITAIDIKQSMYQPFMDFRILESKPGKSTDLLLSPDFGLCADCRLELHDPSNRRYHYPFITCTQCGPRYSIMTKLPYDRVNTSMKLFDSCEHCLNEYNNIQDRRFYAQTNSCPACAIQMTWIDLKDSAAVKDQSAILNLCMEAIEAGKIVAVKGVGGYLLMADATNLKTIEELRHKKGRLHKPFALMYPNISLIARDAYINQKEKDLLLSSESPVVLLRLKNKPQTGIQNSLIAPGLNRIGVMLPYTPLFELLLNDLSKPVIATSANLTNEPIIYKDEDAINQLNDIADYAIVNNREIIIPQDDSVVKVSDSNQVVLIRRSRGYAPTLVNDGFLKNKPSVLAMGADLKAAFGFCSEGNIVVSQYLGKLQQLGSQQSFEYTLDHLKNLLKISPESILIDHHPGYYSHQLGKQLGNLWGIPVNEYQHHEAHFASVLAENKLLGSNKKIMGFIWDGTGLGWDGNVWGSELMCYENHEIKSVSHIPYFTHLLGDKMSKEPRIAALAIAQRNHELIKYLQQKFTTKEWATYQMILNRPASVKSSSMGRLFDAVASMLNILDIKDYEGHAAMLLEKMADEYFKASDYAIGGPWCLSDESLIPENILWQVYQDLQQGIPKQKISACFHWLLVDWISYIAKSTNVRTIAFSGGVFQNTVLVDLIIKRLSDCYELYFHKALSPNDECIAFGQMVLHRLHALEPEIVNNKDLKLCALQYLEK